MLILKRLDTSHVFFRLDVFTPEPNLWCLVLLFMAHYPSSHLNVYVKRSVKFFMHVEGGELLRKRFRYVTTRAPYTVRVKGSTSYNWTRLVPDGKNNGY